MESAERSLLDAGGIDEKARQGAARLMGHLLSLWLPEGSTSASADDIRQLMESAAFVLGLDGCTAEEAQAILAQDGLISSFRHRKHALDARARTAAERAAVLRCRLSSLRNLPLHESLHALEQLPYRYDTLFCAHELPEDLDFRPHGFDGQGLQGIDYAEAWLYTLEDEATLLEALGRDDLGVLLSLSIPGYHEDGSSVYETACRLLEGRQGRSGT